MSVQSEIVQWNLCALTCEHAVYLLKHAERTCISATLFAMAMDIHTHTHTGRRHRRSGVSGVLSCRQNLVPLTHMRRKYVEFIILPEVEVKKRSSRE